MGISYMSRRQANTAILAGAAVLVAAPASATQETEPIALPPPRSTGGKPLIEALMLRRSTANILSGLCRYKSYRTSYGRRQYGAVRSPLGRLTPNALTASACRTFRLKSDASMLWSIPALSGRMSICSARRKDSERSSEVPSITTSSVEPCNLVPTNSSPSRKPSVICGISAGWTTGMLEQLPVRDSAEWLVLSISSSPSQPSVLQRA
jgi:hypothetical protein